MSITPVSPAICLCRGIKLKFSEDAQPVVGNCFCTHCSVGAGGPFQLNLCFDEAVITVEDPDSLMVTYEFTDCESGKSKLKYFCGKCGCTMFTKPTSYPGKAFVRGSLIEEGCKSFKPTHEIFTKNRPPFMKAVEGAAQYDTQPA